MMDAIVQFLRNFLCCIKDLELFPDSFLWDPLVIFGYYKAPNPVSKTRPLEVAIALTQFYAFVSVTLAGFRLIKQSGMRKLKRLGKLQSFDKGDSLADKIVTESLTKESAEARRSIFVGINVASIGIAFFWLVGNSLHVTETNWIGGLPGLIHALTVMEIALVPLLCYMVIDAREMFAKAKRMVDFAALLRKSRGKLASVGGQDIINSETYSWIVAGGWSPYWNASVSPFEKKPNEIEQQKAFNEEVAKVKTTMDRLLAKDIDSDEKEVKILRGALNNTAEQLEDDAFTVRMEGYREIFYFFANFVAFYGYMLGILVYYFDDEENQHDHVRSLKFGMSHQDADWHGNFAGDFMWTIEPIVILGSPSLIGWLKPRKKAKSD
mmetsp:Transcript_1457/g.1979  ORF Transcript_1457/g.1979 Transcript_1457/m.1979 type:complete len:380 (-) Transcript_1457:522-1661(-)